ncbi:MAG: hydrogen peroxide-inducible genes activator [Marinicaulis sp.]|nr:hydrogen peroxide-inducible genes activator [Marinicaulis sp.]
MTIKQLKCLLALEEVAHFRRAAELCGIAQPSLSAQIAGLEEALSLKLVERSRSGVALTPAGREVAMRGHRILNEVHGIVDYALESQSGMIGTLRLGSKPTLGPYLLPHVVATLHRKYKDLNLYIRESEPRELEFELAAGQHDLILTQLPALNKDHVEAPLFQEPLYLALAVDHPLAKEETLHVKMLKGLDVLSLSPNFHLHDRVHALCDDFGARLIGDYEGTSLDALRQMVGMGMGATFLPALYANSEISARSEVVVKKLKGRQITRPIGLIWRKSAGRASAYKRLGDIIRDVVRRKFKDVAVSEK